MYQPGEFKGRAVVRFPTRNYSSYLQAQTFPTQVYFSGLGNVCTQCPANENPIYISSAPASQSIPLNRTPPIPNFRPIATASDALLPANIPRQIC